MRKRTCYNKVCLITSTTCNYGELLQPEILSRHGINVIMCTPTEAPPAWLTYNYPDTLMVDSNYKQAEHGIRRHYCYTSKNYARLSAKPSHKAQFRAWLWSAYAHGADAYVVFRWRTCLFGYEQELEGLLEHSGHPSHRYQKAKAAFNEIIELLHKVYSCTDPPETDDFLGVTYQRFGLFDCFLLFIFHIPNSIIK